MSQQDAASRVVSAALGNGLTQNRSFNVYSGRLENAVALTAAAVARLQEGYTYDVLGNVLTRSQYWDAGGFQETFTYDTLNRLWTSQVTGQAQQTYTYDAAGNMLTKTGLGNFTYPSQGASAYQPHAVQSITNIAGTYSYDKNGNLLSGGGRTATWTSFDMPLTMKKGTASATFYYGPEHERVRQTRNDGDVIYTGVQEVEPVSGGVRVKTYWPNGIGMEIDQGGTTQLNWLHVDRLGSPVAMTAEDGTIRTDGKLEYDAWGKRRSTADNASTDDSIDGKIDNRGFTGHEMLDQLDLVHMNGRVYDPLIGRFMSGDPLVKDPVNGQNYNRYSYVLNNPTNLTDPTGFEVDQESKSPAERIYEGQGWVKVYQAPDSSQSNSGAASGRTQTAEKAGVYATQSGSANSGSSIFKDIKDGIASWWNSSVNGFKSESALGFINRVAIDTPNPETAVVGVAGAIVGSIGKIEKVIVSGSKAEAAALRAADAAAEEAIHLHHAWPKYLGGEVQQQLVPLSKSAHDAYHSGLDKVLPRQRGTVFYQNLSPAGKAQVMQDLHDYTSAFDSKYGTELVDAMFKNGFKIP